MTHQYGTGIEISTPSPGIRDWKFGSRIPCDASYPDNNPISSYQYSFIES